MPFLHFFDGFRTSRQVDKIEPLADDDLRALVREDDVADFRSGGMTPDAPVVRGTPQNPDVFFQAREACNSFHQAVPEMVHEAMDELAARTGRRYGLVEYHGAADAVQETVDSLVVAGERVGMVQLRLFQPFPAAALLAALPPTVRSLAVLDRTKEPGAVGEPLYLAVVAALAEAVDGDHPPFARHSTVVIYDDVTHLSLPIATDLRFARPRGEVQAVFFGLGSDGTVGANKASVKIIGEHTDLFAQGSFVYDSKRSGSVTVSHLRFGPAPIRSTYLIDEADFVACHQFGLLERMKVLHHAKAGATFLLNSPFGPDRVWDQLPSEVQRQLIDKRIDLWVIDAYSVAAEAEMGNRVDTVMQPCFFKLSGVLPEEEAIARIKAWVEDTYGRRGRALVERNFAAVPDDAPDFVKQVTAVLMAGDGDLLPVSALPVDGTFPHRDGPVREAAIAKEVPIWDPDICIDCALAHGPASPAFVVGVGAGGFAPGAALEAEGRSGVTDGPGGRTARAGCRRGP